MTGDEGAGGQREAGEIAAQARALLSVIREMEGHRLTPDEADAVTMLIQALRALVSDSENAHRA